MKWDYKKFFARGNVVGINQFEHIDASMIDYNGTCSIWPLFANEDLSYYGSTIQYIIRLDEHGNVVEHLFDRSKDMPTPMPQLENGMFVSVYDDGADDDFLGVVVNNNIVYQDGTYDRSYRFDTCGKGDVCQIKKVWDTRVKSFDFCKIIEPIWEAKQ